LDVFEKVCSKPRNFVGEATKWRDNEPTYKFESNITRYSLAFTSELAIKPSLNYGSY